MKPLLITLCKIIRYDKFNKIKKIKEYWRPKIRSDCFTFGRPCPYALCRHHLFLDVLSNGDIKMNFPDLNIWDMKETCVLDIADEGSNSLVTVGKYKNITRERIRQIEAKALNSFYKKVLFNNLSDLLK